jgi:methylated-DNA-[protein]-cysteine S-methyltransferase
MASFKKIDLSAYTPFQQRVFRLIRHIPKGKVWTYGEVARRLGNRHLARAVGHALAQCREGSYIPCHRVVGYNGIGGYSSAGGTREKLELLNKEGYKK